MQSVLRARPYPNRISRAARLGLTAHCNPPRESKLSFTLYRKRRRMKPELPLTEATADEIICRTTYQIVLADYRKNPACYDTPTTRLLDLSLQWRLAGLDIIAEALQSVAIHVSGGNTIASWRSLHSGLSLQRSFALSRLGRGRRR